MDGHIVVGGSSLSSLLAEIFTSHLEGKIFNGKNTIIKLA